MTATDAAPKSGTTAARWIGQRAPRTEDVRMVAGRGHYVDDVQHTGMLHASFVRSPAARGAIRSIDTSAARELAGVVAVLTGEDINPRAHQYWQTMVGPEGSRTPVRTLAVDDVRYVGEPIAVVLAESRYIAEDAAELIDVDIEFETPVVDMHAALEPDSVAVHPELGDNIAGEVPTDPTAAKAILDGAAHVFSDTYRQHRYLCVPMETRGIVATWDPFDRTLDLRVSCQSVHETRLFFSRFLDIPEGSIHVTMGDVGGSFGQKMFTMREENAVVIASMLGAGGRPVKWIEDRSENLMTGGHAREESAVLTVGVDSDGRLLAATVRHVENVGAYPFPGNGMNSGMSAMMFPGPYRWSGVGSVAYEAIGAYTNTCGHCAYRGPWMWETTVREQMMDVVAGRIGMDPLEFRRRNVIHQDELPFVTATQLMYETVSPSETLEQAAEMIGYDAFRAEQVQARSEGRLIGLGLSVYIEPQPGFGILGTEAATIRIEPSGLVNVFMSVGSHGQSLETTLAQIIADELGVAFTDVRIIQGDTASTPYGPGTGGSRSGAVAGGAAHAAASSMREKVLRIGAHLLEASVEDVEIHDSVVSVRGVPDVELPLAQIAAVAYLNTDMMPPDVSPGLEVSERYKAPMFMFSNAAHAVTVEVDRVTGQVTVLRHVISEDCGPMVNPTVVEGQISGGSAQAIGGVFYEHMPYDENGNPLATTFLDYLLPTAAEVPDFEYGHVVTKSNTPGGYKGLGEGGAICAPAALINAVRDALSPLGVEIFEQPLSPDRLLTLMDDAEERAQQS